MYKISGRQQFFLGYCLILYLFGILILRAEDGFVGVFIVSISIYLVMLTIDIIFLNEEINKLEIYKTNK